MNTCKDLVEEQDPDYVTPGPSNNIQQQKLYEKTARTNTSRKINAIIEKEFTREIDAKENEILLIQNRLNQALKTLHLLRYVIITDFYNRKQCISKPQGSNENKQTRIHPAIKKVIGQSPTHLSSLSACININNTNNSQQQSNSETTTICYSAGSKINDNESEKNNEPPSNDNDNSEKRLLELCGNNSNEPLKKIPRHIPPKCSGPVPQIPSRGDRHKIVKRIIVGNISKWIPPDWREDDASHKWTMYVRGSKDDARIDDFVAKIRFFLHPSYRPNDIVEVTSPPFHLSRRGWGEFPLRVQLHFKNTANKPMDIIHNLKLDRTYTGLQTLGSETIVDIWIKNHNTLDQLSYEESASCLIKNELNDDYEFNEPENNVTIEEHSNNNENKDLISNHYHILMDHDYINFYQSKSNNIKKEDNNVDNENTNRINNIDGIFAKKIENIQCDNNLKINKNFKTEMLPLEIIIPPAFPQNLDSKLSSHFSIKQISLPKIKNQCIAVNLAKNNNNNGVTHKRSGSSLLKVNYNPSRSLMLGENSNVPALQIACHSSRNNETNYTKEKVTIGKDKLKITTKRDCYLSILKAIEDVKINDIESLMRFIVKKIPIINECASDPEYRKIHPYVCQSEQDFNNFNVGKQRALEWYRAKSIHSFLKKKCLSNDQLWTVKEIMVWCRIHGYTPPITWSTSIPNTMNIITSSKVSANKMLSNVRDKSLFNTNTTPNSLMEWQKKNALTTTSYQADELIDIVSIDENDVTRKNKIHQFNGTDENNKSDLTIIQMPKDCLPLHSFVCNTARSIGIRITPEELAPGVTYCAAGRLIVKSVECLLEDLLRSSLAQAWQRNSGNTSCPDVITLEDVRGALLNRDEFDIFTNSGLMDTSHHDDHHQTAGGDDN